MIYLFTNAGKMKIQLMVDQAFAWAQNLGDTAFDEGNFAQAVHHYEKALNYNLDSGTGWHNLAEIQLKTAAFPEVVHIILTKLFLTCAVFLAEKNGGGGRKARWN